MSSLFRFFALLAVLFVLAIAMRIYEKKRGKNLEFMHKSWYQCAGIGLGLLLMLVWNNLVNDGSVHEFSQDVAEIIVKYIQKAARLLGLR